jgi:hypothetical protein
MPPPPHDTIFHIRTLLKKFTKDHPIPHPLPQSYSTDLPATH